MYIQFGDERSMLFHSLDDPFSQPVVFPVGNPYERFKDDVTLIITDSLGDFYLYNTPVEV